MVLLGWASQERLYRGERIWALKMTWDLDLWQGMKQQKLKGKSQVIMHETPS